MKYFVLLFLLPIVAFGSELENKCNSLSPGQWAEITDYTGLNEAAFDVGATKTIFTYGNHGVWDSQTRRAYFTGGDHTGGVGPAYLIQFDSKSTPQKWTRLGSSRQKGHARCENWFDPQRRNYGFGYNYRSVNNLGSEQTIPKAPNEYSGAGRKAYVYLPGIGLIQFQSGLSRIKLLADYTNAISSDWVQKVNLDEQFGVISNLLGTDFFAVHDFKNNGVFFGGGIDRCKHAIYYMDSSFQVSKVTDFPGDCLKISPSSTGIGGQQFFVDPATGDLIILADEGTVNGYSYNLTSNTWKPIVTPNFKYKTHNSHIVIPIPSLQCTLLAEYDNDHGSKMWVYKHGEGGQSLPPVDPSPAAPQDLKAN